MNSTLFESLVLDVMVRTDSKNHKTKESDPLLWADDACLVLRPVCAVIVIGHFCGESCEGKNDPTVRSDAGRDGWDAAGDVLRMMVCSVCLGAGVLRLCGWS